MPTCPFITNQLHSDIRSIWVTWRGRSINQAQRILNVWLKDLAREQMTVSPQAGAQGLAQTANAATQTTNLVNFQHRPFGSEIGPGTAYQNPPSSPHNRVS